MAKIDRVPIRNFSRASATIFRGGVPDELGMQFLADIGVKTIIDVRYAGGLTRSEYIIAADHGLNYFNIPLNYFGLPDNVIAPFMAVSLHPQYQPIFLHSGKNEDRVSALLAVARIALEGWPFDWAYTEMLFYKFHSWQIFLKGSVHRFADRMTPLNSQQRMWALQELVESNIFSV